MYRIVYICAEIVAVYVLLAVPVALMSYTAPVDPMWRPIIFIVCLIALVPASIKAAVVGPRPGLLHGIYNPWRPIAGLARVLGAWGLGARLGLGHRRSLRFRYAGALPSYDVIDRLSRRLVGLGVAHRNAGGLLVEDNGTCWWLEATFGENELTGWVEADDARDRDAVEHAIRDFLVSLSLDPEHAP